MKNKLLLLLLLFSGIVNAQIVNIPDAYIKNKLLSANPQNQIAKDSNGSYITIDANNDGDIQVSEAMMVWDLKITGNTTYGNHQQISGVDGLEQFLNLRKLEFSGFDFNLPYAFNLSFLINLKEFVCEYTNVQTLNLSGLINLEKIYCGRNSLQNLNLAGLVNLKEVDCEYNSNNINTASLTSINLSGCASLEKLDCHDNKIAQLNLADCVNLKTLSCGGNNLTSISVAGLNQLEEFNCSGNNLSGTLDMSMINQLKNLSCNYCNLTGIIIGNQPDLTGLDLSYNNLSSLDLQGLPSLLSLEISNNSISSIDFSNCPDVYVIRMDNNPLQYVNLKNGTLMQYLWLDSFTISNPGATVYMCIDEGEEEVVSDYFSISNDLEDLILTNYCTFTPGGNYNAISGTFTYDNDNNGCSATDLVQSNIKIDVNDGTQTGSAISNESGNYSFYTQSGNFTLTPQFENNWFTITPPSATVNFANNNNNTATQNFCITPNGVHPDVEVVIVPIGTARPGFDAHYKIIYKNKGNQTLSGSLSMIYDDAVLDYVSATPAYATSTTGQLSWNYSNLASFENREINVVLNLNGPMETPPANIGDALNYTVNITPAVGDETPSDNTFTFNQEVVGSFDPNDITCLEGETVHPDKIGQYLHYNINFENTGTAPATFIVVKDMINAQQFDVNTLQVLSASHNVETRVTGNKVEFIFDDINLAAQGKGNVVFKIKTKPTVAVNSTVTQKADIFFDYNWPILTNHANTTFTILSRGDFATDSSVKIYPNPAKDIVNVEGSAELKSIQLYDVQGRLLQSVSVSGLQSTVNIASMPKGIYFIKAFTEKGTKLEKIIKE